MTFLFHLILNFCLQKKKFDSADYFTEHEKLKKAAGLADQGGKDGQGGSGGSSGQEEAKKQ